MRALALARLGRVAEALEAARACTPDDPGYELAERLIAAIETTHGAPGELVTRPERYRVGELISVGGMGQVRAATDEAGREVAVKLIRHDIASDEDRRRFEREARITARLQHPGIVPLYGRGDAGGHPFYAMKRIPGRPLEKLLAEAHTLEERLAYLPRLIAVSEAIAYAHSRGVVHRDLKPSNVIAGDYGETLVIDWGLAKQVGQIEAEATAAADADAGEAPDLAPAETAAGRILGTPAYMPPEQAFGLRVDTRADVYALGAMLYHLVAGTPPYLDHGWDTSVSWDALIARVRCDAPTQLVARQGDAPRDLVAIIEKAMAREPAARYATAAELTEDLRRFQTGQLVRARHTPRLERVWRWARRRAAHVITAALALCLLAVVGALALRQVLRSEAVAVAQRALADEQRHEAEALLDFMLHDLHFKLKPVGRTDVLEAVARKAADYYARRPLEDESPAALTERAIALRQIATVLAGRGDGGGALSQYRAALALLERAAARDPENPEHQMRLAETRVYIGDALRPRDTEAALREYRAGLAVAERLVERAPTRARRRLAAVTNGLIANVLRFQGKTKEALVAFRAAHAVFAQRAAERPADVDAQRDLAVSHFMIGGVFWDDRRDAATAVAEVSAALAVFHMLAVKDPHDVQWQEDMQNMYGQLFAIRSELGDLDGAARDVAAELAIAHRLAERDPENAGWQDNLAIAAGHRGDLLRARGDLAGALQGYREALAILERVAARDPHDADRQYNLLQAHTKIADALRARGDRAGALAEDRAALALAERLVVRDGSVARWREQAAALRAKVARAP